MKTVLVTLLLCSAVTVAVAASGTSPAAKSSDAATYASQVVTMVRPVYPMEMLRGQRQGFVRLDVAVDSQGRVVDVRVLESSNGVFAASAVRAVMQWRFVPASKSLADAPRHVDVPIRFLIVEGMLAQR